ncbi:uncharacterized protein LOC126695321 [Quercus robur]|uniref:uncharacterized protein LOC126695321 n=1 Tax=Quercus robur TaxID=38942 RepID=UPI002163BB2C|nr:uncharacterized protein LOC126695321 [Quercus robur]
MELRSDTRVGSEYDGSHLGRFWRSIWSCNSPHKIRHFAWRACRDVLPTKENLVKRKVLSDSCCDECKLAEETSGHLFWSCQRARDIWSLSSLFQESWVQLFGSFMDMLWYVVMVAQWEWEHSDVEKLIVVAWALWSNRNECRNRGVKKSCQALLQGALEYLDAYQACVVELGNPKQPVEPEHRLAGVGILIRDAEGHLIGACSKKLEAPLGAIEAEAKAVELGLLFARDLSIQDFTLESDSLMLINVLQDLSPPPSSVAALVYSLVAMSHSFRCVDFSYVGCNGNRPAHLLARHALGIAELSVWVEETPCFLEQALKQDVVATFID